MLHHLILKLLITRQTKHQTEAITLFGFRQFFFVRGSVRVLKFDHCFYTTLYADVKSVFCAVETDRCSSILCLQGLHSRAFTTSP